MSLKNKKVLTILRHANSLNIVKAWTEEQGGQMIDVALDPVELPNEVAMAVDKAKSTIAKGVDVVVLGTKVYDPVKGGPSHLTEFLNVLKQAGIGSTPICLTHLEDVPVEMQKAATATGLNLFWVGNDNLKRDQMNNLGPLILKAVD